MTAVAREEQFIPPAKAHELDKGTTLDANRDSCDFGQPCQTVHKHPLRGLPDGRIGRDRCHSDR